MATLAYKRITASGVVLGSPGRLAGFFVCSSTSGTITLYDNATTNSGTQITGTTGSLSIGWYPLTVDVVNGIYCTVGGTLDITFVSA